MSLAPVSVAIVGDDRNIQRTFGRVERRAAQVASAGERFTSGLRRLGDGGGVTRVASGFREVGRRVTGAVASMGRFAPALAGLTSIATVAGLARLVETWTSFGSRLGLDAQRIGIASRNLHSLQGAARLAGSSAEALTSGMTALGDNLVDAAGGRSPETIQMLATLGVAFLDVNGHARTAEVVLPEVADRIAAIRNPAMQARAAVMLFGGAGEALLPFLRRGAAGIADYNAQALRYGVINAAGVQSANELRESQARLGLAVEGVGYAIAERVAPVLVPLLNRFADWISENRQPIADFFGEIAEQLKAWANSGGPARLLAGLKEIAREVGQLIKDILHLVEALGISPTGAAKIGFAAWLASKIPGGAALLGGFARAAATRAPWIAAASLSGDTPGGGSGRRLTPEEMAEGERRNQQANDRYGYNGNLWHDVGQWLFGGQPGSARRNRALGGWEHSEDALPAATPRPTSQETEERLRIGRNILMGQGWSADQSAGIMAGLLDESGLNPGAVGDNGQAYGIGQHHPSRRASIEANFGRSMIGMSFEDQIRAVDWELRNGERAAADRIRSSRSAAEAGYNMRYYYERPLNREGDSAHTAAIAAALGRRWENAGPSSPVATAPPVAPVPPPVTGAGANGSNGTTTVRLEHVNPPAGLKTSVQTQGDVTYGGLRIERPALGSLP